MNRHHLTPKAITINPELTGNRINTGVARAMTSPDSILLIIISVAALFEIGGELMLRYTAVIAKTRAEGKAEGIVEGKAEGRAEVYREWRADWERRRQEAQVKGIPFDEPPPPNPGSSANYSDSATN